MANPNCKCGKGVSKEKRKVPKQVETEAPAAKQSVVARVKAALTGK